MAKRKRKKDPHAHIDRLVAGGASGAGESRRAADREAAATAAAVPVTAARWLVADTDRPGASRAVDLVAELLALDPRTSLTSRDGRRLRALAAAAEEVISAGAVCPSGTPLLEVLVADEATRLAVAPALDLDALLSGADPVSASTDRTIRLATALMERAAAHRAGEVDLVLAVAPVGLARHARAAEVEALAAVVADRAPLSPNPAPAVALTEAGWLGASPVELFTVAAAGVAGPVSDVVGEALARWLMGWAVAPDAWRQTLLSWVPVDADGLLHDAAVRAGSDHPAVLGGVLVEQIGLRHPLG